MADTLTPEELSKDKFFTQLSEISSEMVEAHGHEFAMGALIMAAQWLARGQDGPEKRVEH